MKAPDLQEILGELVKVFGAGAGTILLRDEATKTLRLSRSTDPSLGSDEPVVYRQHEGLTGWVFAEGRSLRVPRSNDKEALIRAIGRDVGHPRFSEHDASGCVTAQFLGSPIRTSGDTYGVVRLSRALGAPPFSADEEVALEFFADLLGIALKRSWDLLVAQGFEQSASSGFAISHRETLPDGTTVPRLTYVNSGALQILGYQARDVAGKDASDFYALGEYDALREELQPVLQEALAQGWSELGPGNSHLKGKDGLPRAVRITYRVLADQRINPPEIYTIGIFRDITDDSRAQAQHSRLLKMLRKMGLAYFRASMDGQMIEASDAEADILGYSTKELAAMNRASLFEDPEDRNHLMNSARESTPGDLIHVRQPLRGKEGLVETEGYLRTVTERLEPGQTTVEGLYQDVTDRIKLQRFVDIDATEIVEEDVLHKTLLERESRQRQYLSSLGHQLTTPLGSLVGTLEDLKTGLLGDKGDIDANLKYVIGQTRQCMRMVHNLSYLDKVLRNETFLKQHVSIAKLCIETKLDFQHLWEERKISIDIDDHSIEAHLNVYGHIDLLRQVTINLIDNALKYSVSHSRIKIGALKTHKGSALEISNVGLPIPSRLRKRIFERGFRTHRARRFVPDGTGLGLWLVRLILESHGATIECRERREGNRRVTIFRLVF